MMLLRSLAVHSTFNDQDFALMPLSIQQSSLCLGVLQHTAVFANAW